MLSIVKLERLLKSIAAVSLLVLGYISVGAVTRLGGTLSGFFATVLTVTLLLGSAVLAHAARLPILEAILGTLIMAVVGLMILFGLTEMRFGYGLQFHLASIVAVLCGGGAYWFYRRKIS